MRWFTALNMKDTAAYANPNARMVYFHMLCSMDYLTRTYTVSSRGLAIELGLTRKTVTVAIEQLVAVGLIRCQEGSQARSQATTYIISDIDKGKEPSKEPSKEPLLTINKINFTLTCAREEFLKAERLEKISEYLGVGVEKAEWLAMSWCAMMEIRQRTEWTDERDAWQHLLSWCDKRKKDKKPQEPPRDWSKEVVKEVQGPATDERIPDGWKKADWDNLVFMASRPGNAPIIYETYQKALKSMSK